MDRESIKEVVRDVWGGNTTIRDQGDWVQIPCPLAPWTHEKGADASPSFGIHVDDHGTSATNCFTCKSNFPFHVLLQRYSDYSGEILSDLVDEVMKEEYLGPRELTGYDSIVQSNSAEVHMPIDEGFYLDLYEPAEGHPYLRERGISRATTRKLELRFDPGDSSRDKVPRILFPVRSPDGLLYGFSGRSVMTPGQIALYERRHGERSHLKVRDYFGLVKSQNILGSHLMADAREIFIVEGLFDYANGVEQGYSAGAVMHSTLTDAQAAILRTLAKPTYPLYDNDKAGRDGIEIAKSKLKGYLPLWLPKYPKVWLTDPSEKGGGHWLKDPGEMLAEDFAYARENADIVIDERPARRYSKRR